MSGWIIKGREAGHLQGCDECRRSSIHIISCLRVDLQGYITPLSDEKSQRTSLFFLEGEARGQGELGISVQRLSGLLCLCLRPNVLLHVAQYTFKRTRFLVSVGLFPLFRATAPSAGEGKNTHFHSSFSRVRKKRKRQEGLRRCRRRRCTPG